MHKMKIKSFNSQDKAREFSEGMLELIRIGDGTIGNESVAVVDFQKMADYAKVSTEE